MPNHLRLTPSGDWEADPLVTDERFMVADVTGKGLAIFTGCSHAGVVNVCRHAQDLFPGTPLYALVSNCIKQRKNASFLADGPPF